MAVIVFCKNSTVAVVPVGVARGFFEQEHKQSARDNFCH